VYGNFLPDLLIIIPFFFEFFGSPYTNYFLLLRITRIKRTFDNIEEILNLHNMSLTLYELSFQIFLLVLVAHFCACTFHYIAHVESTYFGYTHTWQDA
jgi:Ion transport protein